MTEDGAVALARAIMNDPWGWGHPFERQLQQRKVHAPY